MKRGDLWIGILLLVVASAFIIPMFANGEPVRSEQLKSAVIKVDGQIVETAVLGEKRQVIRINTAHGDNVLEVSDYKIRMLEADCPDKLCVWSAPIQYEGEIIVCLPHRLIVEVSGPIYEGGGVDAVVQ